MSSVFFSDNSDGKVIFLAHIFLRRFPVKIAKRFHSIGPRISARALEILFSMESVSLTIGPGVRLCIYQV